MLYAEPENSYFHCLIVINDIFLNWITDAAIHNIKSSDLDCCLSMIFLVYMKQFIYFMNII